MKNKVSDWMTQQPVTIDDHASIIEAIHLMSEKNVRRLPVMHHGRLQQGVELLQKPISQTHLAARVRDLLDQPQQG